MVSDDTDSVALAVGRSFILLCCENDQHELFFTLSGLISWVRCGIDSNTNSFGLLEFNVPPTLKRIMETGAEIPGGGRGGGYT